MGLVTGLQAQPPRTHSQWVAGPGRTPQEWAVGRERARKPGRLTCRQEEPSLGALVPPQQRAKPARKSARCGVGDGSPRPHPPHPQPVGSGPRPHASRPGSRARKSAHPRTPTIPANGAPPPPGALVPPHSAQSQLARALAVRLMTGPHAHSPRTHSKCVAGFGRTPQGQAVGRGRVPNPGRPTPRQTATPLPPGALVPPRKRAKPAHRSARRGVGDWSPRPHPPHPQPVGSGPRPHAPRTGGRVWKSAKPRTPHTQARGAPPCAPSCRPHSTQSQLARVRALGLVTGPHTYIPRTHSQWVAGPGRTPQGWAIRRGRAPNPGRPTPRQEAPPPPGAIVPPTECAKPARKRARYGVGDGSPGPHPGHPQTVGSGPRSHARRTGGRA